MKKFILSLSLLLFVSSLYSQFKATVSHVYDGDTYLLQNGEKVRLASLNCPEIANKYGSTGEPCGLQAKKYAEKLVSGKEVRVEIAEQGRDAYGRLAVYIFADSVFVNAMLISHGYADYVEWKPNRKYRDVLLYCRDISTNLTCKN